LLPRGEEASAPFGLHEWSFLEGTGHSVFPVDDLLARDRPCLNNITSPRAHRTFRSFLFTFLAFRDKIVPLCKMTKGASPMDWVTPEHEEIDLNCEVSSYANAEL
jgi:hypothetical protein